MVDVKKPDFQKVEEFNQLINDSFPELRTYLNLKDITVVVDTNIVLNDIAYYCHKKVRTAFLETMINGTLRVYAPLKMKQEVEFHLAERVSKKGIEVDFALKVWKEYYIDKIKWINMDGIVTKSELLSELRDPDDADFIKLYELIKPDTVLSKDKHIRDLGVTPKDSMEALIDFRSYSRDKEVVFYYAGNGCLIFSGVITTIDFIYNLILWVISKLATIPKKYQIMIGTVILASLVTALIIPKSRGWLKEKSIKIWQSLLNVLGDISDELADPIKEFAEMYMATAESAISKQEELKKYVTGFTSAFNDIRECIAHVLSRSNMPLLEDEIIDEVSELNISIEDIELKEVVPRILRENMSLFEETKEGWKILLNNI